MKCVQHVNKQTLVLGYLTHHQPASRPSGCWPARSNSFSWHGVYCLSCTYERAAGHQPSYSWHACVSPSKAIHCWLREPDHEMNLACSFSRDQHRVYSPRICPWPEELVASPMCLLVLLEQGWFPGQRLK